MKRIFFFLAAVVFVGTAGWANLRAPKRVDGFLSGSLKSVPLAEAIALRGEELRVVFPDFQDKLSEITGTVEISVRYEIDNVASGPVALPVRFLAVDIRDLAARLNGEAVPAELAADPAEKTECLVKLAQHRSVFTPELYRGFLSELRKWAGLRDVPDNEWLSGLEKTGSWGG